MLYYTYMLKLGLFWLDIFLFACGKIFFKTQAL